jgi:hypothetical protein
MLNNKVLIVFFFNIGSKLSPDISKKKADCGNGKDATKRVASYVKKTKFPVHVLMDTPLKGNPELFQVASAYNIDGIPAKIVIDRKGKLRFSTKGYSSDAELINELEAMIAIAKAQ